MRPNEGRAGWEGGGGEGVTFPMPLAATITLIVARCRLGDGWTSGKEDKKEI